MRRKSSTGGKARDVKMTRTGEIPVPTVQSGWKKTDNYSRIFQIQYSYTPKSGYFFMVDFDKLMVKAFRLADKGLGYTSPNPAVGAIIVKNGSIISTGYHHRAGQPHAEIEALKKAGDNSQGATIITTLEPCSHQGKTPPCVDAIIAAGIKRVVSAISDVNPIVSGKGFRKLKEAGLEVIEGVWRDYAQEYYKPYFKFITTQFPFVTLKYAQTLDGRLATKTGHSQWISSPESLKLSHKLRAANDAIIIGNGTLKKDNPKLTTRLVKGLNPIRVVISESGKVPLNRHLFTDGQAPTFIATSNKMFKSHKVPVQVINIGRRKNGLDLADLMRHLGAMGIINVLVEGGSQVLTSFIRQKLVDKMVICIAPIIAGDGIDAIGDLGIVNISKTLKFEKAGFTKLGQDIIFTGYPVWV